jgi:hypothetical protein
MIMSHMLILTAQTFLAFLLLGAGLHKSARRDGFRKVLSGYRLVPRLLEAPLVWIAIGAEVGIAVGLLFSQSRGTASYAAGVLFVVYFVVLAVRTLRDKEGFDCGCSFAARVGRTSGFYLVRTATLALLSVTAGVCDSVQPLDVIEGLQVIAAAVTLWLLYLSIDLLSAGAKGQVDRRALVGGRAEA